MYPRQIERHRNSRIGWMRAAVLGANDGILSTASLILGVAAAHANHHAILVAGVAGLVSGSMSMAAGEYISVHSQADTERADIELERVELETDEILEHKELALIYIQRGLTPSLAQEVSNQLMAHDALDAHLKDELGISKAQIARPIQAAVASAGSFALGAAVPLLVALLSTETHLATLVSTTSIVFLGFLGCIAAKVGGAKVITGGVRVTFWGVIAMGTTSIIGTMFGVVL